MDNKEIKSQNYSRLLAYAKPYKVRLAIGILAGLLAGGSLFGSLLMIPTLMRGIEFSGESELEAAEATARKIVAVTSKNFDSDEQRIQELKKILAKPRNKTDEKFAKETGKANQFLKTIGAERFHLEYKNGTMTLSDRGKNISSIPAEKENGKMTWQFFAIFCFGFVILWIFKNIATYVNHYCTRWVGTRVVTDLRTEVFDVLMRQSLRFYGKTDVGQLISRTTNDTSAIESSVANVIADATRCPIEILACVAAVVVASVQHGSWSLPLILFVGLPLCVLPVAILGRKIRKIYRKSFSQIADVVIRMHEVFTGILVVKAYYRERKEAERFNSVNRKYFKTVVRAIRAQLLMAPLMEVVAVTSTLVFLTYSYSKDVTLAELAQLLVPCFMAYNPIKQLAKISTYIQRSMAAADRFFQLLDTDTELKESPNPLPFPEFRDRISFSNVTFAYDGRKILDGLTFDIKRGSIVAVVGETGSGKTTIANLIARFYDCDGGSISIDGMNVRDIRIADLRRMIGIVTQEPLLFNETISANIAYSADNASMADIMTAAKEANAHEFIVDGRHKEGYDTVVGEKGFKLSGGEKQRIAIARAILKNPPILILDEATSALDTVTEKLVQDALNHVMSNRTVFAIAHRLSTIKNADKIIVLEKGRIIESGTHEELVALGGKYKKLCDTQFSQN